MSVRTNNIKIEVYDDEMGISLCDIFHLEFNNKFLTIRKEDLKDLVDAGNKMLNKLKRNGRMVE